ncbi:hypothetical protein [Methyloprofundus sp.]|uniref:hypothetical protein n=1 Tax=Methyloprofundus sp. TaxID=2020875 RepID=UPI003D149795
MKQLKWEYTLTLLFAGCSLLILILIVLQGSYSKSQRAEVLREIDNVKSSGFTLQEVPVDDFKADPVADYNEMLERPLFFSERKPIEVEDPENPETAAVEVMPAEEISMALIGILNTPVGAYALFHNPKAKPDEPKFKRLKQGEDINGWTVKEIKHDRVVIIADNNSDEILLAKPRKQIKAKRGRKRSTNPFKQKIKK